MSVETSWRRTLSLGVAMLVLALAALSAGAGHAHAFAIEFKGRAVKRTVLALYDSRVESVPSKTRLHRLAEMPLNHLGYMLDYRDVNEPLPDPKSMAGYRGVITWFVEDLAKPRDYLVWLNEAMSHGGKLIVLGEVAPREIEEVVPLVNQALARIGMKSLSYFTELTHKARVTKLDPEMIGFEEKLNKVLPGFPSMQVLAQTTRAHLTIELDTAAGLLRTTPVATSENGGYVAQNFTVDLDPNTNRMGWLINPFQFFKLALGDERFPIPDVTTISGRRIYLSHIDGDGWNNLTEVEAYRQSQALSAEVVTREAIEPYPDLPVSVGLIAADAQPLLGGNAGAIKWARALYTLPQVEVASHTHTHPYNWYFFEAYNRKTEEDMIRGYRPPDMPLRERLTAAMMRAAGKTYANARYDPYIAGTDDLPRTYLRQPFELQNEVFGALKFSEQFAPAGKRAKLYLWSGDTTPFEAAIDATRRAGVRNMNGGDSRFDAEFPSVAYVPPLSRMVGKQRHIYAVNSNENTYTNDWTGPYGGQMMLEHTLQNTEEPRRLKGFNLYYHMYSGEKQASLRAIRYFLDLARKSEVTPIEASHYAAMADDFFDVRIEQVDLFAWALTNRGTVQTMRLDEAAKLEVDFDASVGVIGARRKDESIYVTLDPTVERAIMALKARADAPVVSPARGRLVTLVDSRWRLEAMTFGDCKQTFRTWGFGPAEMTWAAEKARGFKVRLERGGKTLAEEIKWSDANGQLKLRFDVAGIEPADLSFTCHE